MLTLSPEQKQRAAEMLAAEFTFPFVSLEDSAQRAIKAIEKITVTMLANGLVEKVDRLLKHLRRVQNRSKLQLKPLPRRINGRERRLTK